MENITRHLVSRQKEITIINENKRPMHNNGQINALTAMAANMYSNTRLTESVGQVSGLLTIFNMVDRHVGGKPTIFFGRDRGG